MLRESMDWRTGFKMQEEKNTAKMVGVWYALISLFSLVILFSFYRIYQGESSSTSLFTSITFLCLGLAMIGKEKKNPIFYGFTLFAVISLIAGIYFLFSR